MFAYPLYPVFLSLTEFDCLIIGFGEVGRRKLAGILPCKPASVLILDICENLMREASHFIAEPNIKFIARKCTINDIRDHTLVFAATNDPNENLRLARLCKQQHVFCNCATTPENGSFMVPSIIRKGGLSIALSTGGQSPLLARVWKKELTEWASEKEQLAKLLGLLRPLVIQSGSSAEHKQTFSFLISGPVAQWLLKGNQDNILKYLKQHLPQLPETRLKEIINECSYV